MTTKIIIRVQQSLLQNPELKIYRTLTILMIYDNNNIPNKSEEPAKALAFGKS